MSVRIAFSGASGTGKTTLAKKVAAALGLELQPSFAREVATDMGVASPYDVDALGRREEFQTKVMERLLAWQVGRHARGYVTDRTVWDAHTYTVAHAPRIVTQSLVMITRACNGLGIEEGKLYTRVVFCPMASFFKLGDDAARKSDHDYHTAYERLLLSFLETACGDTLDRSIIRYRVDQRDEWVKMLTVGAHSKGGDV